MNASNLPLIISLAQESSGETRYENHPIAFLNDHVVRIGKMIEPYPWHFHPNSDEVFLSEGNFKSNSRMVRLNSGLARWSQNLEACAIERCRLATRL